MPHLIIEYSNNIIEKEFSELFKKCNQTLAENLPTDIDGCKSRSLEYENFRIGNGNQNNAFVHVTIKILPGRTQETIQKLGDKLLILLKDHFAKSATTLSLQITIEIREMSVPYFKIAT